MPVSLLNPSNKNPDETHEYDIDVAIFDGENWGIVFDRGYTKPSGKPVYAYKCDDNVERTIIESNIVDVEEQ